jgi:hypothetical protein
MKIGAQDKKKVIIMSVLLLVAVPLLIHTFVSVSGSAASSAAPEPSASSPPSETASANAAGNEPDAGAAKLHNKRPGIPKIRDNKTLDPTLRTDILAATQKIEYSGGDRNIFQMGRQQDVQIGQITQPVRPVEPPHDTIIPPPPPPQIPLKYYGFSNRPGEAKKAFLQDGDNIFVAVEGDVVERRYRIVKITNNSVLVEDVLNNNQQSINLTAPATTG